MKKSLFVLFFAIAVLSIFVSCNNNPQVVYYHVKVMNGEEVYKEKEVVDGGVYVLPSVPENQDKKPFSGWKIEGGGTELLQPGEDLKITGDTEITAVWSTICIVTFDTDGGVAMSSLKIPYGEKINISGTPVAPTKVGYTFVKWVLEDGTTEFSFDDEITKDTTIKAIWNINEYEVSFDLGYEGATSIATQTVKYGNKANAVPNPTRTGFLFTGWKDKAAGVFDFANQITRKTELEAQWAEIKTNLTLLFPKDVNFVDTLVVQIGGQEKTFKYSEGTAEGDYLKYTTTVNGLDYGNYTITVETKDSDEKKVGTSHFDTLVLNSLTTDKEVQVDSSVIVNITPTITANATSVTGTTGGYVIKGTASMQCADNTTVKYSTDGSTPTEAYSSGTEFDVTNSTTLSYTVTYSGSNWCTGKLSYSGKIDTDIPINTIGATGPAGGTIFYDAGKVTSYPESGNASYSYRFLEVSTSDLEGKYTFNGWGAYHSTSSLFGAGKANTELLKNSLSDYTGSATEACVKYSGGGYTDWFLPSLKEMKKLYEVKSVVSGISSDKYWTSSELNTQQQQYANVVSFADGTNAVLGKTAECLVRPVRCF